MLFYISSTQSFDAAELSDRIVPASFHELPDGGRVQQSAPPYSDLKPVAMMEKTEGGWTSRGM